MPSQPSDGFADRLERLFHEALELDPPLRGAFLVQSCDGDATLQWELEHLLAASARVDAAPGWALPAIGNEAWFLTSWLPAPSRKTDLA